jgi:MFS family permease
MLCRLIMELSIAPYAWAALINFAAMFGSLMVLPVVLEQPPYSLNAALIGVAYVPIGLGGFLVSPVGGKLADVAAGKYPSFAQGRLLPATFISLLLMPVSLLTYGWTLHYKNNLAGPLIGHFFTGVALSVYFPAIFSYITVTKQQEAGSAAAAVQALMFIMAGVFVLISIPITEAIGVGPFVSILAGLVLVSFGVSAAFLIALLRKYKATSKEESKSGVRIGSTQ